MSSNRQHGNNGLTERVSSTLEHFQRYFTCYNKSGWVTWLPKVEFAYNASRALGIKHTPFEASYGFSPKEPPECRTLLLPMRPSIPISRAVEERLQQLRKKHELLTFMLRVHKDDVQARS
jgi:hypothetical protein